MILRWAELSHGEQAARRPAAPENWDYFRGPVNAAGRARVALQVLSLAQDIDFTNKKAIFHRTRRYKRLIGATRCFDWLNRLCRRDLP
jgi:hypothetical protein